MAVVITGIIFVSLNDELLLRLAHGEKVYRKQLSKVLKEWKNEEEAMNPEWMGKEWADMRVRKRAEMKLEAALAALEYELMKPETRQEEWVKVDQKYKADELALRLYFLMDNPLLHLKKMQLGLNPAAYNYAEEKILQDVKLKQNELKRKLKLALLEQNALAMATRVVNQELKKEVKLREEAGK